VGPGARSSRVSESWEVSQLLASSQKYSRIICMPENVPKMRLRYRFRVEVIHRYIGKTTHSVTKRCHKAPKIQRFAVQI